VDGLASGQHLHKLLDTSGSGLHLLCASDPRMEWIWPLSRFLAQLVAHVTRYRADGSVLNQARANYTLCRRDGSWKVVLSFPLLEEGFDLPVLPFATG
jgi:hypothetical protein